MTPIEKINRDPGKGIIWVDDQGHIVAEKDAVRGEIWIDGNSHIILPRKKTRADKDLIEQEKNGKTS